jgi:hypothetical protein
MAEYVSSLTDIAPVRDYLNRVGATARGLRSAVVMEVAGKYWRDLAIIKFDKDGGIRCSSMINGDRARLMVHCRCTMLIR